MASEGYACSSVPAKLLSQVLPTSESPFSCHVTVIDCASRARSTNPTVVAILLVMPFNHCGRRDVGHGLSVRNAKPEGCCARPLADLYSFRQIVLARIIDGTDGPCAQLSPITVVTKSSRMCSSPQAAHRRVEAPPIKTRNCKPGPSMFTWLLQSGTPETEVVSAACRLAIPLADSSRFYLGIIVVAKCYPLEVAGRSRLLCVACWRRGNRQPALLPTPPRYA